MENILEKVFLQESPQILGKATSIRNIDNYQPYPDFKVGNKSKLKKNQQIPQALNCVISRSIEEKSENIENEHMYQDSSGAVIDRAPSELALKSIGSLFKYKKRCDHKTTVSMSNRVVKKDLPMDLSKVQLENVARYMKKNMSTKVLNDIYLQKAKKNYFDKYQVSTSNDNLQNEMSFNSANYDEKIALSSIGRIHTEESVSNIDGMFSIRENLSEKN